MISLRHLSLAIVGCVAASLMAHAQQQGAGTPHNSFQTPIYRGFNTTILDPPPAPGCSSSQLASMLGRYVHVVFVHPKQFRNGASCGRRIFIWRGNVNPLTSTPTDGVVGGQCRGCGVNDIQTVVTTGVAGANEAETIQWAFAT